VYRGCTVKKDDGFLCAKAVVGSLKCPLHKSSPAGAWEYMYRFHIFLCDSALGLDSPPLRLTIFVAAPIILCIGPERFSELSEMEQIVHVHKHKTQHELITVFLSYNPKNPFAILQGVGTDCGQTTCTPRGVATFCSPSKYQTPMSASSSTSKQASSNTSKQQTAEKDVKNILFDLMDALGHASIAKDLKYCTLFESF
jgi:hypothetical protein